MVTLKQLEKERIEKIRSMNESQIENYVNVLVKELCDLHDFKTALNPDERIDEISDVYSKLKEISELNIAKFENIKNYITNRVNDDLLVVYLVKEIKQIVETANMKNMLIESLIKEVFNTYIYLQFNLVLFHGMFKKLNYLNDSATSDDKISEIKDISADEFNKIFRKLIKDLSDGIEKIDKMFYSDDVIIKDISDIKDELDVITESDDDLNVALVRYGIVDVYSGLINAYISHLKLKRLYIKYKSDIVDLIESDNAFYEYSKSDFESVSGDVDFDEFMKSEPKYNLSTGELFE